VRRTALLSLALLVPFALACRREPAASLLYVTDAHEIAPVVDPWGERGGVARLKTVVDRLKRREPDALLVFGGDLAGGTLFGGVLHGEPMVDALGTVGVGLAAFGQHDFDFGAAQTRRLVARSRFPWITSNLVDRVGAPFDGLPTRMVRRVGSLRVGFLALTDDMETTTQEGEVVEQDLLASARREAEALRRDGAEAIVALTQTGAAVNERLLREVPLLDAVLTEEEARERSVVRFVGARPIAAPCADIGSVVELRLVATRGGRVRTEVLAHPVDASVPADPGLAAMERDTMARLAARLSAPVASLAEPLAARTEGPGSPLGDVVADAFREATGAELALVPTGSLRADLPAGPLTRRELAAVLPFGNRVVLLEVSGSAIREAIELALARPETSAGTLQLSGGTYETDPEARRGARLRRVNVGGEPLRGDRLYRIAVSSYLAGGGDGLTPLARARRLAVPGGEPIDADAVASYLARLESRGSRPPGRSTPWP
jgi:5'-nucleotidase